MEKCFVFLCSCLVVIAGPIHLANKSQLSLLLDVATLTGSSRTAKIDLNDTTRVKRSSDTEYDYYKDVEYYNYYGVEDPYYDEKKAEQAEFNFEKSLDTKTQVLIVVSIVGLLLLFCIWQVCCYPAIRLCSWYCTYWGTLIRMAVDSCRGIDPRYRMMEKMVTSMGFAMPSYSEWKQWMAAYEDMMLQMAEGQCEGITDMVKGFKSAMGPMKQMMGQGMDQMGNVGAIMGGIGDGLADYASGMPMGGIMF
ncbi:uncharacterized protein LOC119093502 isoform X2 [Pollicipes pollicipes]|uniref:uncharacterized protein LOC119093502 isoform X2 n=1 Tax=Pollicipes pollicipes TaxID=41117 RepID=UPI00188491A9|nr:uncharacterized protein LOC119093502 isoform X2 [Pollicipes pollicipes]